MPGIREQAGHHAADLSTRQAVFLSYQRAFAPPLARSVDAIPAKPTVLGTRLPLPARNGTCEFWKKQMVVDPICSLHRHYHQLCEQRPYQAKYIQAKALQ